MSHDICPDTGEPCACDGSEPCTCGCGGCGHTAEEEAAAAAYREAHREGPFGDALAAFRAATEGRITPADYHQLVL